VPSGPDFSTEFSAPPEFPGGVLDKNFYTRRARTSDLLITNLYQCATVTFYLYVVPTLRVLMQVSSVVSPTAVTGVHALVFTHALAGTHALPSVSALLLLALLHAL
jgi:hypothetical protein